MKKINLSINEIIKIVIISFVFLLSIVTILTLNNLNILPTKYMIGIIIVVIILNIIEGLLIIINKKPLNIIGYVLAFILFIINCILGYYIKTTDNFLNEIFAKTNTYTNTFIVVSKESKKIEEINEIGYYKKIPNIDKALEKLEIEKQIEYQELSETIYSLNEDKTIIIEKNLYNLVFELDKTLNKDDFKILYEFEIVTKKKNKKVDKKSSYNIYIGGTDFTNEIYDFNMLVSVSEENNKVLLTSIPRDYHIKIGDTNDLDNINYHGTWGINTTVRSLENLLDTKINYYVKINATSLVKLVDLLGGIEYCSDEEYTTTHALVIDTYNDNLGNKLYVKKGCQKYSGIEVLTISRERLNITGSDIKRQENCRKILESILKKLMSIDTLVNYEKVLNSVNDLYETNIDKKLITNIIKDKLKNNTEWKIESQELTGTETKGKVHLSNYIDYIMIPDQKSIDESSLKIKEFINLTK